MNILLTLVLLSGMTSPKMDLKREFKPIPLEPESKYSRSFLEPERPLVVIEDPFPYLRKDYIPPMYNPCPWLKVPGYVPPEEKKYYLKMPLPR